MTKQKKLPCGAVGCCHEGRKHHHCGNCGVVVLEGVQAPNPYIIPNTPYNPWNPGLGPTWISRDTNLRTVVSDSSSPPYVAGNHCP